MRAPWLFNTTNSVCLLVKNISVIGSLLKGYIVLDNLKSFIDHAEIDPFKVPTYISSKSGSRASAVIEIFDI